MVERVLRRLTWRNAVPIAFVAYAALNVLNAIFEGTANAQRIPWEDLGRAAQHPLTTLAVAGMGLVWLVFFSDARAPKPPHVMHHGLLWRKVNDYPRPFCPGHDVRLLARANAEPHNVFDLDNHCAVGTYKSSVQLRCPAGGGHMLPLGDDDWRVGDVAAEVRMLLEQIESGRKPKRVRVVS